MTVPKGFRVDRDSDDPDDLRARWKHVAGAHHYTVSVFDGATDTARVGDTDSTTLRVAGTGFCNAYRVLVAAVNKAGTKALLLRLWTNGRECGNPIAKVKWPEGLEINAPHRVTAVIEGDQLYATIDNVNLFSVPSLTDAVSASGCGMPAPTGTEVGFRTWSSTGKALFEQTTLN